jgi:hypothetical protein
MNLYKFKLYTQQTFNFLWRNNTCQLSITDTKREREREREEKKASRCIKEKNGLQLTHAECDVGARLVCRNPPVGQRVQHPFQILHMLLCISETNLYRMNDE